jgi:methylmalonyl-CoA mutase
VALNKFDKRGALDAIRDVKKQYQRNHNLWDVNPDEMPVLGLLLVQ